MPAITPCIMKTYLHLRQLEDAIYSVSQKKVAPLKLVAVFSLLVNLCN